MYLVDTSVILELLLDQDGADEAEQFLRTTPSDRLHLTEFTLYSLGIILLRRKMHDAFVGLTQDLVDAGGIRVLRLGAEEMANVVESSKRFDLDFDDAYQYTAAEKPDLVVVSFDGDFDRTDRRRACGQWQRQDHTRQRVGWLT